MYQELLLLHDCLPIIIIIIINNNERHSNIIVNRLADNVAYIV